MVTYLKVSKELAMEHEVEDGPICIVRIVNPCLYWIRCSSCFSISDIQKVLQSSDLTKAEHVKRGDRVAVKGFDGNLYRGVVQCRVHVMCGKNELLRYKLFLMDKMENLIVEPDQLFHVKLRSCIDDLTQQLHLVGIELGRPIGNLESGFYLDEVAHNESQRKLIFSILKSVKSVEFQSKRKYESVTFGKMKLFGNEYRNLLRVLIDMNLAQYRENLMSMFVMPGWIDTVTEEQKAAEAMLFPSSLDESPKEVIQKKVPPPPAVVFDQKQVRHLQEITKSLDTENLLDRVMPNPKVESFEEMNNRYRIFSRCEAILKKNGPVCREQKFEYNTDSSLLVGGFVDVEIESYSYRRVDPPTSSDEDYNNSSLYQTASSSSLSTHESDLMNENIPSYESDVPLTNRPKNVSDRNISLNTNLKFEIGERTSSEKQPSYLIERPIPELPRNVNAAKLNSSASSQFDNKKFLSLGRGKVFQQYLHASSRHSMTPLEGRPSTNTTATLIPGQFDDADSEVSPQGSSRVCSFIPDIDSDIDFLNGFIDESFDSMDEYYGGVIRMNKNQNVIPSPVATRPVKTSPTASLPRPSSVLTTNVQAGELSAEESVSSVNISRSSSVSSSINLPDLLPINKRRAKKERRHSKSDGDSTDSSSQEMSSNARKVTDGTGREKLFAEKLSLSLNPAPNSYHQSREKNGNGSELPHRTLSIIGRGKMFEEHSNFQRALGMSSPGRPSTKITSAGSSALSEVAMKVAPNVSTPLKCQGRGRIFQKPMGSNMLPSQRSVENVNGHTGKPTPSKRLISAKSTPPTSEIEETETELDLSSIKPDSLLDSSLQAKLEAAMKKMTVQANTEKPNDGSSESESCDPSEPVSKPLLSEFVDESVKQELASMSDSEVESGVEGLPSNMSDCFMAKISRALKSRAGILHGATDVLPENYLSNLDLDELIYKNARSRKVNFLTRPQYFGIPAVLKRKNVVFVGPNRSKKSSAFVIPLLSLLMDELYYSTLRRGNGPRCVFVAPTSDRVKTLGRLCSTFCGARLSTITTYGGGLELERKNELAAGCDILITTPRCWLRLLQYPTVTNLSRLCHVVLDRFDSLADLFPRELKQISAKVADLMRVRVKKNEAFSSLAVQMILSAEQWSPAVEEVALKLLNKPAVIITSYLEAILYARIRPKVTLVKKEARFNKLLGLVQNSSSKKTVIVCTTPSEVTEVRKACSAQYIPIVAHENMAKSLLSDVDSQWCSSKLPPLLICTDAGLLELGITDAQVLIHFSLPENKSSFCERFVVLRDHLSDRILNPKVAPPQCVVHIMFDEACEAPFPFIVDFLRRISAKIPDIVFDTVKDIERKKEERKTSEPFCENILQLGSCYKAQTCKSRHVILPKLDSPKGQLMSKGLIKVQIIYVHSAVKYSARILAHNPNPSGSGPWTKYKSDFATLTFKMGSFFASPQNRRLHGRPKIGDLCAYQEDLDRPFFRARVVQITKRDDRQEPTEVEIFLVDEGIEKKSLTHTLFELPEDLKKFPDQAAFIYLANLKPVDLDTTWSFAAKKVVDKAIHTSEIEDVADQDIIGKILITIGRNCVVENLMWCRHMTYSQCFTLDLRQLLLNSGCGMDNPEYSTNLAEICSSANMEFGLYHDDGNTSDKKLVLKNEKENPPQWAHLSHEEDFILVNTVVDESPSLFYVKMKRFQQNLIELEKDLSANLNKSREKVKDPQIGDICAAENPDYSENEPIWNRCIIYDISGDEADIFFVDYGDKKCLPVAELYSIPWKFVIKLPFQAIECKLAGVQPGASSETEWLQNAIDAFHNMTVKDYCWGEFYVKVLDLDLKGVMTGGRCYHVILVDVDGDVPVMVNKKFVDMGYGALSSLDFDETDLLDAYKQIKEFESRKDASRDDDDDYDDDENWDAPADGAPIPTLTTNVLPAEEAGESNLLDFNFDEVDLEDLRGFAKSLNVPEWLAVIDKLLPPAPAVLPITDGSTPSEDDPKKAAADASRQGEERPHKQKPEECPGSVECSNRVLLPTCVDDVERPLLVRCAPLKTPLIYWRQDRGTVTIKYMIPCLENYKVYVNLVSVSFRALLDNDSRNDEYWKRISLFGPVLETNVSEKLTVTCLRVTLFKRVPGYLWPRLTHTYSRDHRIKLDPEDGTLFNHKEDQGITDQHFERGYKKFKSEGARRKNKHHEQLEFDLGSSDEDDTDEDEFFEYEDDDVHDPFNPLA